MSRRQAVRGVDHKRQGRQNQVEILLSQGSGKNVSATRKDRQS